MFFVSYRISLCLFFFQAEDGIRDFHVTGVQTCALPICRGGGPAALMLTAARREPHAIEAGLKEGADAYLTKPIDSRELLARVRAALETHRLKRMLESQRRDHIAMLVHDLRHPLSSLGLIAELLQSDDLTPEERKATITQIRG